MKTYNIYKKRDGQDFKNVDYIYADNYQEACIIFAKRMTDDNHNLSNNIQWLTKEEDGVNETGWYDFNGGRPVYDEATEKYDADEAAHYLLVSQEAINAGFSSWNQDVYTWEIRDCLDYVEIYDMDDFESKKEDFSYFMSYDNIQFYLYNGTFSEIAEMEGLGVYNDTDDKFMGCPISEIEFIENFLKA